MELASVISTAFSAGAMIAVAVIEVRGKRKTEHAEHRADMRMRESRLSMQMADATADLCEVICIAVTGGHTNGNVEEARKKVKTARDAYTAFLQEVTSEQVGREA